MITDTYKANCDVTRLIKENANWLTIRVIGIRGRFGVELDGIAEKDEPLANELIDILNETIDKLDKLYVKANGEQFELHKKRRTHYVHSKRKL